MPSSRSDTITMPDGGQMTAHLSLPESGEGPGILVLMEIFGVGPYIQRATERLTSGGSVSLRTGAAMLRKNALVSAAREAPR